MKKFIFLAVIAATVVASCAKNPLSKEENVKVKEGMIHYKAAVKFDATKSTLATDDERKIVWEVGEKVAIFDDYNTAPNEFTVTGVNDGGAWIEGEISDMAEKIYGVYPFSAAVKLTVASVAGDSLTVKLPSVQTIETGKVIASDALVTISEEADPYGGWLYFYNPFSVLKFTVPVDGVKKIEFSGLDGKGVTGEETVRVDDKLGTKGIKVKGKSSLTVSKADGFAKNTAYYATVFSRNVQGVRFVLTADDYTSTIESSKTAAFCKNCGLTFNFTEEQINAGKTKVLLPGEFSVSATKKVKFTKGNLWWNGSEWKIESNQTDYPTEWSTSHVGHFYWTNITDYQSGEAYWLPYAENFFYFEQSMADKFFCGENNPLAVDGQSGLYALSKDEWSYLLSSTGRGEGDSKFMYGVTVNDVAGYLVIAPDGYTGTIAESYDATAWSAAESAGLVCLPLAGYRGGSDISSTSEDGCYWSATPFDEYDSNAYCLLFSNGYGGMSNYERSYGYSIRLVSTVSE